LLELLLLGVRRSAVTPMRQDFPPDSMWEMEGFETESWLSSRNPVRASRAAMGMSNPLV